MTESLGEFAYSASPLDSCDECQAYWQRNRESLAFASASVGIEHGLTTNQALWAYFRDFHKAGHLPQIEVVNG